jgi:hypothetical protein
MGTPQQLRALTVCVLLFAATSALAHPFKCASAITSNFNGTAITAGDRVWFNAVLKVNGLGSAPATIFVTHASITFTANGHTYLPDRPRFPDYVFEFDHPCRDGIHQAVH